MPLTGFYQLDEEEHKSKQQGISPYWDEPPTSPPQSDVLELVWENGQAVVRGQTGKTRNNTTNGDFLDSASQEYYFKDKCMTRSDDSEIGKLGMIDFKTNDSHLPVPSGLEEHNDRVPWLTYRIDKDGDQHDLISDSMSDYFHLPDLSGLDERNEMVPWLPCRIDDDDAHHDYSSDFFTELSTHTTHLAPMERGNDRNLTIQDHHLVGLQNPENGVQHNPLHTRPILSQLDEFTLLQSQPLLPSQVSNDSARDGSSPYAYPSIKMQSQGQRQVSPSSSTKNFSHFAEPAALVKSSLDTRCSKVSPDLVFTETTEKKGKGSVQISRKPADPVPIASTSGQPKNMRFGSEPKELWSTYGSKLRVSRQPERSYRSNSYGHGCCSYNKNNDVSQKQVIVSGVEKILKPVGATSLFSGNSIDRASNDATYSLKRKHKESEDTEYPKEEAEEESWDVKKAATNRVLSGSNRSRAAEMHKLSERRRRDRINEKMREIQELIPNCNKVDKASMLDEAIEYLKNLQLQVQMMSMRPGLCMPPMMLPHKALMPRFSPTGAGTGMGLGMGFGGLGMHDMNGNASSSIQMPPVLTSQFPFPPVPGLAGVNGSQLSNRPVFAFPEQGIATPMPSAPTILFPAGPPIQPFVGLNASRSGLHVANQYSKQTSQSKTPDQVVRDDNLLVRKAMEPLN